MDLNLKNCPRCGKLFAKKGPHKLCPVCRKEEESQFEKVKEYLWDNPNASIEEVHDETGVEKDLIMKFVREGRLIAEGIDVDILLECERCGASIKEGRFCQDCQQELMDGLDPDKKKKKKKKQKKENKSDDKMFLADRVKKRKKRKDD